MITDNVRRTVALWAPAAIWITTIFWFSHQPKAILAPAQPSAFIPQSGWSMSLITMIDWDTVAGKGAHIVVFGFLAFLLWRIRPNWRFVLSVVFVIALFDEFHQLFIDGRTGRLLDVFIDIFGAMCVVWLMTWQAKIRKKV